MIYAVLIFCFVAMIGLSLYYYLRSQELSTQIRQATESWSQAEAEFNSELARLEKFKHIPDIVERARKSKADVEARLADAEAKAEELIRRANVEAKKQATELRSSGENELAEAQEFARVARLQAQNALTTAQDEVSKLASQARKDTMEKKQKAKEALESATLYGLEIRHRAEQMAQEIVGEAHEARAKSRDYEAVAKALKNRIDRYEGVYLVPAAHILDELAEEFGFNKAGEKLKLARERTRLMQANGQAVSCKYPDGWKKDHALKFVLSTFNGRVDTILARVKPGNHGKLTQEIKDAFSLVNKDGEVYKDARIEEEYLDSRLDELRWAVAVQKLKERSREEQRTIREQIREEQRAQRELDRAIKQAEREETLVNKAIEKIKKQFEEANVAEKAILEAQLLELNVKLVEAEEKGRKAISMAQMTKQGHVYIISNVGSFGENVYKIGLTRRLDPSERVRELGDASVPFPFDIHALLFSEDAPALETALHKRFVEKQVNKINKRKEFFRIDIGDIREVAVELGLEATWTLAAEASQYRETLTLEQAMRGDVELRKKWLEDQATFDFAPDPLEDEELELEEIES